MTYVLAVRRIQAYSRNIFRRRSMSLAFRLVLALHFPLLSSNPFLTNPDLLNLLQTNIAPSFIPIDERYGDFGTREWDKWSVTSNINGEIFVALSNSCIYQLRLGRLNSPLPSTDGWIPLNSLEDPSLEPYAGLAHLPGEVHLAKDGARLGEAFFGKIAGMDATNDERGRIWIADERAHSVRVVVGDKVKTAAGNMEVALDGTYLDPSAARDGAALGEAVFCRPTSVLYMPTTKTVVITERGRKSLRLLDLKTMTVSTVDLRLSGPTIEHFRLFSSQQVQYPQGPRIIRILDVKSNTCYNVDVSNGSTTMIDKNLVPLCTYVTDDKITSLWYGKHSNWIQWDLGFSEHETKSTQTLDDLKSFRWIDTQNAAWMYYSSRHNIFINCNPTYKGFNIVPNFLRIKIPNSFPPPFNPLIIADPSASTSYTGSHPIQPMSAMPNQAAPSNAPPTYHSITTGPAPPFHAAYQPLQAPLPPPQQQHVMMASPSMGQVSHQILHVQPAPPHMGMHPPAMAPSSSYGNMAYAQPTAPATTHAYPTSADAPQQRASPGPIAAQPPQPTQNAQAHPQTSQSKASSHAAGDTKRWTVRTDLSSLRTSPFPGDVHVTNTASGRSWNLHSEVLLIHTSTECDSIVNCIIETTFPVDTVEAFVGALYCKRIADTLDLRKSCTLATHVMHIWKEIGLENLQYLLVEFATTIVRHLTPDLACDSLLDMWSDKHVTWQLEDAPIQILTSFVRGTCRKQFLSLVTESDLPSKRIIPLVSHISALIEPYPLMAAPYTPSLPELPLAWSKTCEDDDMLDVSYQTPAALPEKFIKYPSDYALGFDENTEFRHYWLVVSGIYLWPRWTWFRQLVASLSSSESDSSSHASSANLTDNGEHAIETSKRVVRMPSWVTANILLSIINCMCHSAPPVLLLDAEVRAVVENARELDLVDDDGAPVGCFLPLLQRCLERSFPPVSELNILSHYSRYLRLRMEAKLDQLAGMLIKRNYTLNFSKVAAELELDEITELFDRVKRLTPEESV